MALQDTKMKSSHLNNEQTNPQETSPLLIKKLKVITQLIRNRGWLYKKTRNFRHNDPFQYHKMLKKLKIYKNYILTLNDLKYKKNNYKKRTKTIISFKKKRISTTFKPYLIRWNKHLSFSHTHTQLIYKPLYSLTGFGDRILIHFRSFSTH